MLYIIQIKLDHEKAFELCLDNASALGTDLVEASWFRGCCAECAKRRGRWFSVSGNDKRFPKLEKNYGCTCEGLIFSPVMFDSTPRYFPKDSDMIKISNLPFIDDRSDIEKEIYEIHRLRDRNEQFWYEYDDRWCAIREYDHQQYDLLTALFPDIAPKSYSGYMRMKKGNTKNYQKLVDIAKEAYIFLEYPQEMLDEIEFLTPLRKIYVKTITEINSRKRAVIEKLNSGAE